MACEKRPYLCGILILGLLALFFHLVGFVTPGWLIMRLSFMEESRETTIFQAQLVDHGGLEPPKQEETAADKLKKLRKRRSEEEIEIIEEAVIQENEVLDEWIMETTIEIKTFEVSTHYGLWYSTLCIHEKTKGSDKHNDHSSSEDSSSEDDDNKKHKKGHCHCRKISTKCALYNSFIYEDPIDYINPGPSSPRVLSTSNFGYASLTEHRVENCLVLAFLVLGLISALGFRKVNGCRCAAVLCVMFMLAAALIALVPVSRLSHYSVAKYNQKAIPVKVHAPYSAIASGLGALFALITALVASCATMKMSRKEQPGKWYQFNNELEIQNEKEKKPALVFVSDPLPEKPGLEETESEKEAIA